MDDSVKEVVRFSSSDLKKLRFFVLFAAIIILAQVFQFVNTKRLDNKYNTMLANENRLIVALNSINVQSTNIHRSLLTLEITPYPAEMTLMNQRIIEAEKRTEEAIALIEKNISHIKERFGGLFDTLKIYGSEYTKRSREFKAILQNNDKTSIDKYRMDALRPCLERYQEAQNALLEGIASHTLDESEKVSSSANRTGWLLLIGGNTVLLFVMIFIIYLLLKPNSY